MSTKQHYSRRHSPHNNREALHEFLGVLGTCGTFLQSRTFPQVEKGKGNATMAV